MLKSGEEQCQLQVMKAKVLGVIGKLRNGKPTGLDDRNAIIIKKT